MPARFSTNRNQYFSVFPSANMHKPQLKTWCWLLVLVYLTKHYGIWNHMVAKTHSIVCILSAWVVSTVTRQEKQPHKRKKPMQAGTAHGRKRVRIWMVRRLCTPIACFFFASIQNVNKPITCTPITFHADNEKCFLFLECMKRYNAGMHPELCVVLHTPHIIIAASKIGLTIYNKRQFHLQNSADQ